MKARAGRLFALIGVSGAIVMTAGASSASATQLECSAIQGAGSSLQNIAQTKVWGPAWEKASSPECKAATVVKYRSSSTGKGKAQWGSSNKELNYETAAEKEGTEHFPAFNAEDVGPSTAQQENMDIAGEEKTAKTLNEMLAVPVEQSAISVMVTLPVGCEPETGKTSSVATGVHLQEEWEKHALSWEKLFSGLKKSTACEAKTLSLEARSSASGTTAGFKRFLGSIGTKDLKNAEKAEWAAVNATPEESESTKWPAGGEVHACCEKGSQLAETVHSTAGDVGYADLADAEAAAVGFTTSWVKHKVGSGSEEAYSSVVKINTNEEEISPEASNKESNCAKAEYVEPATVGLNVNWSGARQKNTEKESSGAYPICTLTFDVAWHRYSFPHRAAEGSIPAISYTQDEANAVFEYLHWIVTSGQTVAKLAEEHYGKLAPGTQAKAEAGVTTSNIEF